MSFVVLQHAFNVGEFLSQVTGSCQMFVNIYKALTGTVGGAGGRAQMVCVPLRRCTPPGREGGNGWD